MKIKVVTLCALKQLEPGTFSYPSATQFFGLFLSLRLNLLNAEPYRHSNKN
jgi:hypothetical protein